MMHRQVIFFCLCVSSITLLLASEDRMLSRVSGDALELLDEVIRARKNSVLGDNIRRHINEFEFRYDASSSRQCKIIENFIHQVEIAISLFEEKEKDDMSSSLNPQETMHHFHGDVLHQYQINIRDFHEFFTKCKEEYKQGALVLENLLRKIPKLVMALRLAADELEKKEKVAQGAVAITKN
jgi:hypothetical protein